MTWNFFYIVLFFYCLRLVFSLTLGCVSVQCRPPSLPNGLCYCPFKHNSESYTNLCYSVPQCYSLNFLPESKWIPRWCLSRFCLENYSLANSGWSILICHRQKFALSVFRNFCSILAFCRMHCVDFNPDLFFTISSKCSLKKTLLTLIEINAPHGTN